MKAKNIFRFSVLVLFTLFICLYITQALGYYEFTNAKKTTLTRDAMEKFERDIQSGKKIDVKDYLEEEKNYNNFLSKTSITISNTIEKTFNTIMNALFNEMAKATS